MRTRGIALAATTALSVAWCADAWADDAKEKALQQKIDEMQKQIDDLAKRVGDGTSHAGDELEARVAELEKVTKKDKDGLFSYWGNGIRMDSANGAFKLKIGGRIQSDWTYFYGTARAEDKLPPVTAASSATKPAVTQQIEAGEEFRRLRLMIGGQIYDNVEFSDEIDFAGGAVAARDVWIALKKLPFTVQVGNFKEPTGTEELTSDLFIPFLERSAGNTAFAPDYKTGVMISDTAWNDKLAWQGCVTRNSVASGNNTGNLRTGENNVTGRIAGKPWANEDGTQYLTFGVAGSIRTPTNDKMGFSSTPELHLAPKFVDTGTLDVWRADMVEADVGFVAGSFWAYADWFNVDCMRSSPEKDVTFDAWGISAGYFLTGESKPYKAANATYDRIKPKANFDGKGGGGAWEIAARWDECDLNDGNLTKVKPNAFDGRPGALNGGKENILTVGVSWYLNPNTRFMLDWVHAKQKDLSTTINAIEARFQIDF